MKVTRREFLTQTLISGVVGYSGIVPAGLAYGGEMKKSNIIDVHHHILPEMYTSSLAKIGISTTNGAPFPKWSARRSIDIMDRNGIQTAITSISAPGVFFGDMQFAVRLARQCNEFSAGLIADYPGRFGGFGILPLPDTDASLAEISYALDTLKLDGIALLSNTSGVYLGDPQFDDIYSELNRRKAVVFIHPTEPEGKNFPKMNIPPSFLEFVFDTTRAVASLIQHNTIRRYPDIRFIVAHGGGTAPYLEKKMALIAQISGWQSEQAVSQLQRIYYDTALSTSTYTLALLSELTGEDKIVFGSDTSFAPEFVIANSIYEVEHSEVFGKSGLEKIFRRNCTQLFNNFRS